MKEISESSTPYSDPVPILGIYSPVRIDAKEEPGRIAVFGDSSCLDGAFVEDENCFWLLESILKFTNDGELDSTLNELELLKEPFKSNLLQYPQRLNGNNLHKYSKVIDNYAVCNTINFKRYPSPSGGNIEMSAYWERRKPINNREFIENVSSRKVLPEDSFSFNDFAPLLFGCIILLLLFLRQMKIRRDHAILLARSQV